MGTVFETVIGQAVREWNNDGRRHEFNVHAPARRIYDGGIITIGSTCRIVVAGDTVMARRVKRKSTAILPESVGEFVRRALVVAANRSKAARR
jgi:hypothetical protein|nr:MAG TPA: hypothetical protein [Caudoviricetes sp.]